MKEFLNPFELLTTDPAKLASYTFKSNLIIIITEFIRDRGMNQRDAAAFFGITQPRISNLLSGQLSQFSIDNLIELSMKTDRKIDFDFNPHAEVDTISVHFRLIKSDG